MSKMRNADELAQVLDPNTAKLLNRLSCEVRNVEEGRLVKPLALHKHLQEMDQVERCLKMAFVSCNVDHSLQHTD